MANKYYIWKDPNCNGTNPDWIEISGEQFFALGENKTRKRYFKRIDDGFEDGADVLIFETTYEEYKEWHKKQESKRRKKKVKKSTCLNLCLWKIQCQIQSLHIARLSPI